VSRLKIFLIALVCVALGYGPELSTYYVLLLNHGSLAIVEDAVKVGACEAKTASSVCTTKYTIDLTPYKNKFDSLTIGAGQIIYATRYFCGDSSLVGQYDDYQNPGKNFDIFNVYQTLLIPKSCYNLRIEAWSPPLAVRKGKVSAVFVAGTLDSVERVKRLSEFFRTEIYQVFTFCFLFLFFISSYLRKALPDLEKDMIDHSLEWWILCAASNAGLIQIILPTAAFPQWQNKFAAICVLVCIPLTFVSSFKTLVSQKTWVQLILVFIASSLILDQNFAANFCRSLFVLAFIGSIIGLLKRDLFTCVLSIFIWGCAFKVYGISWLPNPMTIYFYVGLAAMAKMVRRLQITAKFARFVAYISKLNPSGLNDGNVISALISQAKNATSVPSITLLRILPDSRVKVSRYYGENDTFFVEQIPPAFAHALSIRAELWHIKVGSPEFLRIKKTDNSGGTALGQYFSIIPMFDEERIYGALAITGYTEAFATPGEDAVEQRSISRLLADQIKSVCRAESSRNKSEWSALNDKFHKSLSISDLVLSSENIYAMFAELISTLANASVFVAKLDSNSRKFEMLGIYGFDPFVKERFTKGTLYAHKENEQGPIALAVNRKKPVIISDVRLLKGVLHENSNLFFEKNETVSCAGIPIFFHGTQDVWGVLWLERNKNQNALNLLAEETLVSIANSISQYINLQDKQRQLTRTTETLQGFVPERILNDVLHNNLIKEDDHGYLVMLDLKGSTKISLEKGSDFWLGAAKKLVPILRNLALTYGMELQDFKWDAFIFTLSTLEKNNSASQKILDFFSQAALLVENWYNEELASVSQSNLETGQKARCCVTFGDITRGFSGGTTKVWTLIGAEIAAVSKMEDVCKRLDGVIFFDETALPDETVAQFTYTNSIVPGTGRMIFKGSFSWGQVDGVQKRKAS
jgi:hypothetical protein